jgi:hypothetical protein
MTPANSLDMTVLEAQRLLRGSEEMRDYDRERIDMLQESLTDILRRHDAQLADHEKRIRDTEKFGWQITAIIAVVAFLGWGVLKGLLK